MLFEAQRETLQKKIYLNKDSAGLENCKLHWEKKKKKKQDKTTSYH